MFDAGVEQRAVAGQWVAADCIPSLMTVPLMLGWMFMYESIDGKEISLMKGVPESWQKADFKVEGLYSRYGRIDIRLLIKKDKRLLYLRLPKIPEECSILLYTENGKARKLEHKRKIDIEL
ncbi:MAG: hypothetical protein IKJ65_09070 [Clostridia bacterium]|nr:hypothetical protein [Clostridia bacterium]